MAACKPSTVCASNVIRMISSDALSEAEQAPLKEAASALSTLLLEAARTDVDAAGIRSACAGERGEFLQFNLTLCCFFVVLYLRNASLPQTEQTRSLASTL